MIDLEIASCRRQLEASFAVLRSSQEVAFPDTLSVGDLTVRIDEGVFSPKFFHGWRCQFDMFPSFRGKRVLEVGTGTGIVACLLADGGASSIVATDISEGAVRNASSNCSGFPNVEVRRGDLFEPIAESERFDLIYWNAPFIPVDGDFAVRSPLDLALVDPGYGRIRTFLKRAPSYLAADGAILLGWGGDGFADTSALRVMADRFGLTCRCRGIAPSFEGGSVEFSLWELEPSG